MTKVDSIAVLNHLAAIVYRSLPMYLVDACPWRHAGDEKAAAALANIVADQREQVERLVALIARRGGVLNLGKFPMEFTDTHDLGLDYLMRELWRCQKLDVARIERLVDLLASDREAHELAQEVLGAERAHLEALEELAGEKV